MDPSSFIKKIYSLGDFIQLHYFKRHLYAAAAAAAAAKSLQSCLTLCDPTDGSPPGCPIPGILQARTLEWVAFTVSALLVKYALLGSF